MRGVNRLLWLLIWKSSIDAATSISLPCRVAVQRVRTENGSETLYACHPLLDKDNFHEMPVVLDESLQSQVRPYHDNLMAGAEVVLHHNKSVTITANFPPQETRRLVNSRATGTKRLLIARVSGTDVSPSMSAQEIYDYAFTVAISARSQYAECSWNQFDLVPTSYGVLDLTLDRTIRNASYQNVVSDVYPAAVAFLQQTQPTLLEVSEISEHFMIVLPPGTKGSWLAYGTYNGRQTVFNDRWGVRLSAVVHEIGHNLGLDHAYFGTKEYGDVTGYMGYTTIQMQAPSQCFNAHNHWALGWYDSRSIEVDPTQPKLYRLAAFVDYDKMNDNQYVVLKADGLYMQFNRMKSFNLETGMMADKLVITKAWESGSILVAGLDETQPRFSEISNGRNLIVELCSIDIDDANPSVADDMIVSVGYDLSRCGDIVAVPTPTPVNSPRPTRRPVVLTPTPFNSPRPTRRPVVVGTPAPSRIILDNHDEGIRNVTVAGSSVQQGANSPSDTSDNKSNLVAIVVPSVVGGILFLSLAIVLYRRRQRKKDFRVTVEVVPKSTEDDTQESYSEHNPQQESSPSGFCLENHWSDAMAISNTFSTSVEQTWLSATNALKQWPGVWTEDPVTCQAAPTDNLQRSRSMMLATKGKSHSQVGFITPHSHSLRQYPPAANPSLSRDRATVADATGRSPLYVDIAAPISMTRQHQSWNKTTICPCMAPEDVLPPPAAAPPPPAAPPSLLSPSMYPSPRWMRQPSPLGSGAGSADDGTRAPHSLLLMSGDDDGPYHYYL